MAGEDGNEGRDASSWNALALAGTTLGGRYQLGNPIGAGTFSVVLEARDRRTGRRVAIKLLDPSAPERVEAELNASEIEHPHVPAILDSGEQNGVSFVVLELLVGETLAERIARTGFLLVPEASDIALQLLSALGAGHDQGIVHRDVKPANVFLARRAGCWPAVRLLDFGCSLKLSNSGKRRRGRIVGTPAYMAPEQTRGDDVDARADLYAAGVTLFEALAGKRPYIATSYNGLMSMVVARPDVPHVRSLRPDVPEATAAVVRTAMARHVDARFQSAVEMQSALMRAAGCTGTANETVLSEWDVRTVDRPLELRLRRADNR